MITDKLILLHCEKRFDILQKMHYKLPLSYQDWEDMKQDIYIHIFGKKKQWNSGNGYKQWLNIIIRNQFLNKLRDKHFLNRNGEIGMAKSRIEKFTVPIYNGIIDPSTKFNNLMDCVNNSSEETKKLVMDVIDSKTVGELAKKYGYKKKASFYAKWRKAYLEIKKDL